MRLAILLLAFGYAAAAHAQGLSLVQSADGIVVRDAAGTAYPYPFAGGYGSAAGYLAPKPQLIDLVGDARPDLVVMEGGVGMQVFENVGAGAPGFGFRWRTDRLAGIAPGAWFRFADMDRDGDADLLTQAGPTQMRYYRNDGRGGDGLPTFTLLGDPLLSTAGTPVIVDDNSVPAFLDADADGDLDFFYGQVDRGNIAFWRNDGTTPQGVLRLTHVTDSFEGIEVYESSPSCEAPGERGGPGGFPGLEQRPGGPGLNGGRPGGSGPVGGRPSMRHGANAPSFADLDGDGDREFFWGDYFSRSLWYFRNDGTLTDASFTFVSEEFPLDEPLTSGGYNVASFADVDGDGDQDLVFGILGGLCATSQNWYDALFYYENTGTPQAAHYALRTPRLIAGVDVGRRSVPALGDLDGDGDLDMVLANEADPASPSSANLALYRNTGSSTAPEWRLEDADWLGLDYDFGGYGATLADVDGDGDLDLLVGSLNGRFALMRNTGTPTAPAFTRENDRAFDVDLGQFSRATFGDVDGDGDLDFIGGDAGGRLRVFRNTGSATVPFYAVASGLPTPADDAFRNAIGLPVDIGDFSAPALVDLDGDGDLDLLVGTDAAPVRVFRNTGSPTAPHFTEETAIPTARRATTPAAADFDGDGDVDVMAGTAGGGLLLFLNSTVSPATEPTPSGRGSVLDSIPNPSGGAVTFRMQPGAATGPYTVVVADVQGREVWRAAVPDGADRVAWGGGAAGLYLARLEADGAPVATAKVTLLR